MRKEHANTWLWKDVNLVHNDGFLKEFSEKRSEMRTKGRHGRDMEERFCFLVASYEATNQIYQFGLKTGFQDQYSLGKPLHGVYLFKHVDVALKHETANTCNGKYLIVFKVLFGKVKKVTPSLEWKKTVDPTVGFDCHIAKDAVSYRDSVSQQVLGSLVFLFDYNQNQELNKRPRQCLPYAVVSIAPTGSAAAPLSLSPPVSPSAILIHGPQENLKGCTVAKRTGKGEKATVTFKHFVTPGCSDKEYQSQTPRADMDASAFQYNDPQTTPPLIPHQAYMPLYNTAEYFNPALPYYESGISWQSYSDQVAFSSNLHNLSTTGVYGSDTDTMGVIPQSSAESISTIVYSSRLVKDPRLSRRRTNIQTKSSEEARDSSVPECTEKQACQAHSQAQKEKKNTVLSCEKPLLLEKKHKEGRFSKPLLEDTNKTDSTAQPKNENMPLIKLFKMKFQKYASYFKMTEQERHRKIWSKGNLTQKQKQLLIDRIHFYEMHYQRYKQGLRFQKDTEKETVLGLSHTRSSTHPLALEKANQCEVNQSQCLNVSNLTPTTELGDFERNKVDVMNTENDKLNQVVGRPKENNLKEEKQDHSLDSQTEPQGGGMVQPEKDKEEISDTLIVQGHIQSGPSGKSKTLESAHSFTHPLFSLVQVNNQDVHENEISTSPEEYFACKPTLINTIEGCSEFEQHIILDVANCIDVSSTECEECNFGSYVTEMESGQHSQSSTEEQDSETLTYSKSDSNSKMFIEVKREEAQQQNNIYNSLYERLQLDQLLADSNRSNDFSNKSYLRLNSWDKTPATNLPDSHVDRTNGEDHQLIVNIKSNQISSERLTLSERFSNLRRLSRKLAVFVRVNRLTNSYTSHLNGDLKCKPEALVSCSDGEKATVNYNAELIKLMAQRSSKNRFKANCKRFRQKRSKSLCRKSLRVLSKGTSVPIQRFQVQTRHIRKSRLWKAKKKCTNLALKMGSSDQNLFGKLLSNHVDKSFDSHTKLPAESQSQSGSQIYGKLLSEGSSENDRTTNISTEESPCLDSKNKTSHRDKRSVMQEQYVTPAKESTEIACFNGDKISNHNKFKESKENITLNCEDPVIIEATESKINSNNTSHQEKASLVTCSGNSESSTVTIAVTEHKEEALLNKKLSHGNNCETKNISPDYNPRAYEDTSSPVPTVLGILGDITSDNIISSCTATTQTALTLDLPEVINNEANTPTKAGILGVNAVDSSASGLTQRLLNSYQSQKINKICHLEDREFYINSASTYANIKSDVDQNCIKSANVHVAKKTNHLSELASGSQYQPSLQDTRSSGMKNPLAETTSDFHSRIIEDAQKDLAWTRENLHLALQGHDVNSLLTTSNTQIISKLRDYLTKCEVTVKKQDPANNSITETHGPMAWITLNSTSHQKMLHNPKHYSEQVLADATHRQGETVSLQVAPNKHKQSNGDSQPNSPVLKKRKASNLERVSPDSTFIETVRNEPNSNKDTQSYRTPFDVANMNHWLKNYGNKLRENQIICPQVLGNLNRSSGQQRNGSSEQPCQINQLNAQSIYEEAHTTYTQDRYSVKDISSTLKLADRAVSVTELGPLRSKCKRMLQQFIFNFEKDQKVSYFQSCITRNFIIEKYLRHPPPPVELKFDAINSFLELQMIIEACQFVDNKINFLRGKPTFRSLLWYDPSLYGELYKGTVGFQQQSSLFSLFQQCLSSDEYKRLQEYYCAVSSLHQQLQDAPDTSYYMYLKTKRERLELEAAFRNPTDVKNFFLSVPTAIMINLGDHLDILKKTNDIVMTFIETPADRLPDTFDVGKAEHLSIICRYLHEKILYLKLHKETTKISWFGMEHLLYDASKVLVWSESEHGTPNEVLRRYKSLSSHIVYGMTEDCVALVKKIDQSTQPGERVKIPPPSQMNAIRIRPTEVSPERPQPRLNIQTQDGKKETHHPPKRRAMPVSSTDASPYVQPRLAAQPESVNLYKNVAQSSNAFHWKIHRNAAWNWRPPEAMQSTYSTDVQNSHAVRQQKLSKPLIVKPRPINRSKVPPIISAPQPLKDQQNEFSMPMMPQFPYPSFSPDTPSVFPPPPPPLPFSSTSNPVALHNNPTQINYPYFVFNGQAFSTTGSSPAIHIENQYRPRPV
ncbi:Testis-expressed protein 15 [Bagarius yarrelli]|uniref:Testis-expressed protein 15 n=1 Tax=Bagarius yarrelli TaxID=175774 RepID=A0A556V283_BAGYA|nr:Testis-expressed protein 15 [Bagarius yarrelli]